MLCHQDKGCIPNQACFELFRGNPSDRQKESPALGVFGLPVRPCSCLPRDWYVNCLFFRKGERLELTFLSSADAGIVGLEFFYQVMYRERYHDPVAFFEYDDAGRTIVIPGARLRKEGVSFLLASVNVLSKPLRILYRLCMMRLPSVSKIWRRPRRVPYPIVRRVQQLFCERLLP